MKSLRETIRILISESFYRPEYKYLYHGTTEEAAESIKKGGFNLSLAGGKSGDKLNPGVSFTIDRDQAAEHAIWALRGDFEKGAALVVVSTLGLQIMNGSEYHRLWRQLGTSRAAVEEARSKGYDGIEYFDYETGEGIEEMEVLLLNSESILVSHINYIDPEDFPKIMEEYR